jgi:arylsulfotransferase ASST
MAWQHDVRWQSDRSLTIFDNGAVPREHSQSRVIHVRIDPRRRKVTLASSYVHTPALLAGSQGNDQLLPNGDSFVGWGEEPYFSELGPRGELLFDGRLPPKGQSYRAYRFDWSATPSVPPALAVSATGVGSVTAYVSWNGATGVSAWRILGGSSPTALSAIATVPRTGFETALPIRGADSWFAAQAIGPDGRVLAASAPVGAGSR